MTKSYYEKILPANVHIFYEWEKMNDVKKHKSFSKLLFGNKYAQYICIEHSQKTIIDSL